MSLACDYAPLEDWTIPWPSIGPYYVDSWNTSYPRKDGTFIKAYRVIGKSGFQLHSKNGAVIQFCEKYAKLLCDAANGGKLACDPEPQQRERV